MKTGDTRKAFARDAKRFDTLSAKSDDLLLDYSKCAVTTRTMKLLAALAKAAEPVTVTTEPKAEAESKEDLPIYILAIIFLAVFVALRVWRRK